MYQPSCSDCSKYNSNHDACACGNIACSILPGGNGSTAYGYRNQFALVYSSNGRYGEHNSTHTVNRNGGQYNILCEPNERRLREPSCINNGDGKCYACGTDGNIAGELLSECSGSTPYSNGYEPDVVHDPYGRHGQHNSTHTINSHGGQHNLLCKCHHRNLRRAESGDNSGSSRTCGSTCGNIAGELLSECDGRTAYSNGHKPDVVYDPHGRHGQHNSTYAIDNNGGQHNILCEPIQRLRRAACSNRC